MTRQIIGTRSKLVAACCFLFFVWPAVLLAWGGHYFWNRRIYLVFPVILLFIGTRVAELWSSDTRNGGPTMRLRYNA